MVREEEYFFILFSWFQSSSFNFFWLIVLCLFLCPAEQGKWCFFTCLEVFLSCTEATLL